MTDLSEIAESIIEQNVTKADKLTKAAVDTGISANEILDKGLMAAMQVVGEQFEKGEIFLPELLMSGEAASAVLKWLRPLLTKREHKLNRKAAIGTVQGDIHDMGKRIVIMMLEGNGWEVTDLGIDVAPEDFCSAVREGDFQILGMSSLLTTTIPNAGKAIEALKAAGLRDKVKIMVGGAPVTKEWADKIGADAYAADGAVAVKIAVALIGKP